MADNKTLYVIDLRDGFSPKLAKADKRFKKFDNTVKQGTSKSGGIGGFSSMLAGGLMAGGIAAIGLAAVAGAKKIITMGAAMEQTRVSFEVLLGDKGKSKEMIENLNAFANVTPFVNAALFDSTKKLLSFGFAQEKILPTLKMLGDVAGGDQQKLDSLTTAFARTSANGRLMGMELDMMIDRGFNPLNIIATKTGKSMLELRKDMSKGLISFDQVQDAFITATSEGGKFFNMMEKQSESFGGLTSTIQGKLGLLFTTAGEGLSNALKPLLRGFISFVDMLPRFDLSKLAQSLKGIFVGITVILRPLKQLLGLFGKGVSFVDALQTSINLLAAGIRAVTLPFRVLFGVLDKVINMFDGAIDKSKSFKENIISSFNAIIKALDPVLLAFSGIGSVISGALTMNPAQISGGIEMFKSGFSTIFSGVKDVISAEVKGFKDIFATGLKKGEGTADLKALTDFGLLTGGGAVGGGSVTGGAGGKTSTVSGNVAGVSSGGIKNVTLNIDKLIEEITFSSTTTTDLNSLKEMVTRVLVEASTDSTRLIGG